MIPYEREWIIQILEICTEHDLLIESRMFGVFVLLISNIFHYLLIIMRRKKSMWRHDHNQDPNQDIVACFSAVVTSDYVSRKSRCMSLLWDWLKIYIDPCKNDFCSEDLSNSYAETCYPENLPWSLASITSA